MTVSPYHVLLRIPFLSIQYLVGCASRVGKYEILLHSDMLTFELLLLQSANFTGSRGSPGVCVQQVCPSNVRARTAKRNSNFYDYCSSVTMAPFT